ncbi:MAG: two-component regulator propeller domain-containing protein, partial [Bacteroidota bacterium]
MNNQLQFGEITSLFVDRENILWVSTDNGIAKLETKKPVFDQLFTLKGREWGNTMRAITERQDTKIVAMCESEEALMVIDTKNGSVSELSLWGDFLEKDFPLREARFFAPGEDKNHLYTVCKSLVKIRISDGYVRVIPELREKLDNSGVNAICRLETGQLLFGATLSDLILFSTTNEKYTKVFRDEVKLGDAKVKFLLTGNEPGIVWVGTEEHGVLKIHIQGSIIRQYSTQTTPALSNNNILSMMMDNNGLWIGTFGGGVNYLTSNNQIRVYKKEQGLADNNIVGFLSYKERYIWISTYNGLSMFDKETQKFKNYFVEDGLTHNEFNYSSYFNDGNNELYFGGMNGINRFNPERLIENNSLPPLQFTKLTKFNSKENAISTIDLSYQQTHKLIISPYDQYFTLHWTTNHFFNNDKNQYSAILEGLDKEWLSQNTPSLRYNRLPPGEYTLRLKAQDAQGNQSINELILPIKVLPFFYQTWWFISACILVIAASIYALFRYRLKQVLATERLKTRISSDIHDDVGSVLSGLIMQVELLEMNARKEDLAKLQKIKTIGKNAIAQMRDLVWGIDPRRQKIGDLTDRMQEVADELLAHINIRFIIKVDEQMTKKELSTNVKQNIFLIYKEAINNVVKHSNADRVDVLLCP